MPDTTDPKSGRTGPSGLIWEFPSKRMAVELDGGVIDGISSEVFRGFGLLPRRGAEVGGVLLGRMQKSSKGSRIVIDGFEPVPCRYASGPSYHLSGEDKTVLEETLTRLRSGAKGPDRVVGFYRSHTRKDFFTDDADAALCSSYFAGPADVFLVIRAFASRAGVAGVFFWEEGKLAREPGCQEFLFQRSDATVSFRRPLSSDAVPASAAGSAAPPLPDAAPADADEPPADLPSAPPPPPPPAVAGPVPRREFLKIEPESLPAVMPPAERHWARWTLVPALALAGAAGLYFGYQKLRPVVGAPGMVAATPSTALELAAVNTQGHVDITWNRQAPVVKAAKYAVLTITDGTNQREIQLEGEQIRNMRKLVYKSVTPDVTFHLEVVADQRSLSEAVRLVKGTLAAPEATEPNASGVSKPAPVNPAPAGPATASPESAPVAPPTIELVPEAPSPAAKSPSLSPDKPAVAAPKPEAAKTKPTEPAQRRRAPAASSAPAPGKPAPPASESKPPAAESKPQPTEAPPAVREVPRPARRR